VSTKATDPVILAAEAPVMVAVRVTSWPVTAEAGFAAILMTVCAKVTV